MTSPMRSLLFLPLSILMFGALSQFSVTAQVKKGGTGPFQDLQLLKPTEIDTRMREFGAAVGGDCSYCHMPGDYVTEDNPNKAIARNMIRLTREMNARYFGGSELVTCYTCHHGALIPLSKAPSGQ